MVLERMRTPTGLGSIGLAVRRLRAIRRANPWMTITWERVPADEDWIAVVAHPRFVLPIRGVA